jgi:hypothetical protein
VATPQKWGLNAIHVEGFLDRLDAAGGELRVAVPMNDVPGGMTLRRTTRFLASGHRVGLSYVTLRSGVGRRRGVMVGMSDGRGFAVTPDELRKAAGEVLDVIDAAHQHARFLGGAQDRLNGAPPGFDSARMLAEIENSWQLALHAANVKAAVDADTLSINADSYAVNELHNESRLRPN